VSQARRARFPRTCGAVQLPPHDGVDATNWRAEQAIRPAVVNRKVWGGNRTWRGAETQGRMMSLLRTAAQQGVDAVDFLARLARAPTPAEVPTLFA
jgi:transposase